jgi:hypothetical protein
MSSIKKFFPYIVLFLIVFVLYSKTIKYSLVNFDDKIFIQDCASDYKKKTIWTDIFKNNVMMGKQDNSNSKVWIENNWNYPLYRPILTLSFAVESRLSKNPIRVAHIVNILLHIACVFLFFFFVRRYLFSKTVSFLSTIFFAVHPLFVFSTAWIAGRNDTLLFIFFISSFIFFIEYLNKNNFVFFSLSAFLTLLGVFTKETALLVPVVFIFYSFCEKKSNLITLPIYATWAIIVFLFLSMKSAAVSGSICFSMIVIKKAIFALCDYFAAATFLITPIKASDSIPMLLIGALSIFVLWFVVFFSKNSSSKLINFFYFALPFMWLLPTFLRGRLWFQGSRMIIPLFAIAILLFSFLSAYIESQKTKKTTITFIIFFIFLSCTITYKKIEVFQTSQTFQKAAGINMGRF